MRKYNRHIKKMYQNVKLELINILRLEIRRKIFFLLSSRREIKLVVPIDLQRLLFTLIHTCVHSTLVEVHLLDSECIHVLSFYLILIYDIILHSVEDVDLAYEDCH